MCLSKKTKSKEGSPSKDNFRKETGKLDNWIYHRRIDEYLKEGLRNG